MATVITLKGFHALPIGSFVRFEKDQTDSKIEYIIWQWKDEKTGSIRISKYHPRTGDYLGEAGL